MRREPTLTFEGALSILGAAEPKAINGLNRLLGGIILGSGVAAAVASGGAALAPLAALAPIWGWVDQKSEAVGLLKDMTSAFRKRIDATATRERRELIGAAHTVIVAAAFFDALKSTLGKEQYKQLDLTDKELISLVLDDRPQIPPDLLRHLYEVEVPAPSATQGYEENVVAVERWMGLLAMRTQSFMRGLNAWPSSFSILDETLPGAVSRYREYYADLASSVPEFCIWASLSEHAATRFAISSVQDNVTAALNGQRNDLRRIEALLALTQASEARPSDAHLALSRSNSSRLNRPILAREEADALGALILPNVGDAFIAPAYRVARVAEESRVADENWWKSQTKHDSLDIWLAAHALSADSTRSPLLVLGHPGAGKSMLMKVLAARLPDSDYTVVVVPLRSVGANAPIMDQVQTALDQSTNRRVTWSELADRSSDTIRVVILDGLDELLQASTSDRGSYLQEVAEFQRVEAEQERPLIAIVTSRTVVADRVDIPKGSIALKLEEFDEVRINEWLAVWNETNAAPIDAGEIRGLSTEAALTQPDLACQPLLLLMLALYSANPNSLPLASGVSITTLYQRIIEDFARREAVKAPDCQSPSQIDTNIRAMVGRLSIAALAMFNRGTQTITEHDLNLDIAALDISPSTAREDSGQRLLGEFFFMHTAEATLLGADDRGTTSAGKASGARTARRSYEFLHATFGEYLVAHRLLEELRDASERSFGGRRARDPEDDLIFALLSHQPLAVRQTILQFLYELHSELDANEQQQILAVTEFFCKNFRRRTESERYDPYRPLPLDRVRQMASYSANVTLLRVALDKDRRCGLLDVLGETSEPLMEWRSTLNLWQSGLDADGWHAMLATLRLSDLVLQMSEGGIAIDITAANAEYFHAVLAADDSARSRIRYGVAIHDGFVLDDGTDPEDTLLTYLFAETIGLSTPTIPIEFVDKPSIDDRPKLPLEVEKKEEIVTAIERLLLTRQGSAGIVKEYLGYIVRFDALEKINPLVLMMNVCRFPSLLHTVPQLRNPALYDDPEAALVLATCLHPVSGHSKDGDEKQDFRPLLQELLRQLATVRESFPHHSSIPDELIPVFTRLMRGLRDDAWDIDKDGPTGLRTRDSLRSRSDRDGRRRRRRGPVPTDDEL